MNTCGVLLFVYESVSCGWLQSNFRTNSVNDDGITAETCDILLSVSV